MVLCFSKTCLINNNYSLQTCFRSLTVTSSWP